MEPESLNEVAKVEIKIDDPHSMLIDDPHSMLIDDPHSKLSDDLGSGNFSHSGQKPPLTKSYILTYTDGAFSQV